MAKPVVTGTEYLALPRAPETWLIDQLLPVGGSMLLYGDSKVGKSFAALQLACCLTSGSREWLGFAIPQATPVVYIQLDTPRTLWADRVEKLAASGHPTEGVHMSDRETLETFPFDILRPEHFKLLNDALVPLKPGAVIIDTIREAHSGDENDSTAMQSVIAHLEAAIKPASMILVAHSRKTDKERGYDLLNDNRGSNYIVGRMDAICRFSHSSMRCTSRTMEEATTKLERADDGTWNVAEDPFKPLAELVMLDNPRASIREMARELHARYPEKTENACRAYLRRQLARRK